MIKIQELSEQLLEYSNMLNYLATQIPNIECHAGYVSSTFEYALCSSYINQNYTNVEANEDYINDKLTLSLYSIVEYNGKAIKVFSDPTSLTLIGTKRVHVNQKKVLYFPTLARYRTFNQRFWDLCREDIIKFIRARSTLILDQRSIPDKVKNLLLFI